MLLLGTSLKVWSVCSDHPSDLHTKEVKMNQESRLEWVSPCHHRIELPHWIGDEKTGSLCAGTTREEIVREDWAVFTDRGGRKRIKRIPADGTNIN